MPGAGKEDRSRSVPWTLLRITGEVVEVVVWDSDPVLPVARASDAGRVGQYGLEIVMAVAQGVEARREPVGKRSSERRRKSIGPMPIRAVQFTVPTRGGAAR
ncbi:ATP-binding protein [Streptomyces olivaceoviridis]